MRAMVSILAAMRRHGVTWAGSASSNIVGSNSHLARFASHIARGKLAHSSGAANAGGGGEQLVVLADLLVSGERQAASRVRFSSREIAARQNCESSAKRTSKVDLWKRSWMGDKLNFKESLPEMPADESCPPSDANRPEPQTVIRFVAEATPVHEDFCSHYTLGKPKPLAIDSCRWASCSVFTVKPALTKLPRIRKRYKFIAEFAIDKDSGVVKAGQGGHLDFWMFSDFDPLQAILTCSPL